MSKRKNNQKHDFDKKIKPPDSDQGAVEFQSKAITYGIKPWFSFRYICRNNYCVKKCNYEKLKSYSDKLRQLSELDWKTIESSPRETNGFEMIPITDLKSSLPAPFASHKEIWIFRFGGCGRVASKTAGRIAGIREGERFHILFVDRDFTLYDHG